MERKPVQFAPGALWPTQHGPWGAAIEKANEAAAACVQMEAARDRVSYQAAWSRFVGALEEFWNGFQWGKCAFSAFPPWVAAEDKKRRADEALNYLIEARHQVQHGGHPLEWEESRYRLGGPTFNGLIQQTAIYNDGTFAAEAQPAPGSAEFAIVLEGGGPRLPAIHNKQTKKDFSPPTLHQGLPLANNLPPHELGKLALAYYQGVLRRAAEKVVKK